jgi:hypothetical protein
MGNSITQDFIQIKKGKKDIFASFLPSYYLKQPK